MKKIKLGQAISIIANVGVIGGIVLLAYELHQNNELLESQANVVLLQNRIAVTELLVTDDGLAAAVAKDRNDEVLSQIDLIKFDNLHCGTFSKWEWEHRQYQAGLIASANLPVNDWRGLFESYPSMGRLWSDEGFRMRFSPDFVEFVDKSVIGLR